MGTTVLMWFSPNHGRGGSQALLVAPASFQHNPKGQNESWE